jgi:hypothetical protein
MAKGKSFKSTTGYPVTVWAMDDSGNTREIRVSHDEAYETSDEIELRALEGNASVSEQKSGGKKSDG